MNNLFLLREELRENGERLAYQFLDGLNWKQYTYLDIINSIDYLTYFVINNNIFNNKVYNTGSSSLENTLLTYVFLSVGSSINISSYDADIFKSKIKENNVIIIDKIEDSMNFEDSENNIYITLNETVNEGVLPKVYSPKLMYKFGLLGKNKIDENKWHQILNKDFSSNLTFDRKEESNLRIIESLENLIIDIPDREFSNIFYQKKDLFSLKICALMLIHKKKFTNFYNWKDLCTNLKETLPTNLFIDSNNLYRLIEDENFEEKTIQELLGKNIKRIISTDVIDKNLVQKVSSLGLELINL